jgi:hypothetical protein
LFLEQVSFSGAIDSGGFATLARDRKASAASPFPTESMKGGRKEQCAAKTAHLVLHSLKILCFSRDYSGNAQLSVELRGVLRTNGTKDPLRQRSRYHFLKSAKRSALDRDQGGEIQKFSNSDSTSVSCKHDDDSMPSRCVSHGQEDRPRTLCRVEAAEQWRRFPHCARIHGANRPRHSKPPSPNDTRNTTAAAEPI